MRIYLSIYLRTDDLNNLLREKRDKRCIIGCRTQKLSKTFYPEILLVISYPAFRDKTISQILRFILAFWNGVNLVFEILHEPKVRLNIAGVIIATKVLLLLILSFPLQQSYMATPYIPSNAYDNPFKNKTLSQIAEYFYYKEKVRFPSNGYDLIVPMVRTHQCDDVLSGCNYFSDEPCVLDCSSELEVPINSVIPIAYNWKFAGTFEAAEVLAQSFDGKLENDSALPQYILALTNCTDNKLEWSNSNRKFLSQYFSSNKSKCLRNKPRWRKTVGKVLPGRWMSMDGQCLNEGFEKSCRLENKSMCEAKGCIDKGNCINTHLVPLPGSECGTNKHCSTRRECIKN